MMMMILATLFLLLFFNTIRADNGEKYCKTKLERWGKKEVIVLDSGLLGYDILTYQPKKEIFQKEYKKCKYQTIKGITYVFPDCMEIVSSKQTSSKVSAIVDDKTSLKFVNGYDFHNDDEPMMGQLEHSILKEWKIATYFHTPILKSVFRESIINLKLDTQILSEEFENLIERMLNADDDDVLENLACQLVDDYGGMYLTEMNVGGFYAITNYLKSDIIFEEMSIIKAKADDYLSNEKLYDDYGSDVNKFVMMREIKTVGGNELNLTEMDMNVPFSMKKWWLWKKSLYENPIVFGGTAHTIDKIHSLDFMNMFNMFNSKNVSKASSAVLKAINNYISMNKISGCTHLTSPNFFECANTPSNEEKCNRIVYTRSMNKKCSTKGYKPICSKELSNYCICTKTTVSSFDQPKTLFGGIVLGNNPCPQGFQPMSINSSWVQICESQDETYLYDTIQIVKFLKCGVRCKEGDDVPIEIDGKCVAAMCVKAHKLTTKRCSRITACGQEVWDLDDSSCQKLKINISIYLIMFVLLLILI